MTLSEPDFAPGCRPSNVIEGHVHSTDVLFYSPAFVLGFRDQRAGNKFSYPENAKGPNNHYRSAQIAYERGRQFSVLWGRRPVSNLTAMKLELDLLHIRGQIL